MKQSIIMRGQTESGKTEVLNFSGLQIENKNMAYKMTEFKLYPSTSILTAHYEMVATVTAGKTAIAPTDPDFSNDALVATAVVENHEGNAYPITFNSVVNDHFLITQNLILMAQDEVGNPVNWQCKFKAYKMTDAEMAANNFKQYQISDGS